MTRDTLRRSRRDLAMSRAGHSEDEPIDLRLAPYSVTRIATLDLRWPVGDEAPGALDLRLAHYQVTRLPGRPTAAAA